MIRPSIATAAVVVALACEVADAQPPGPAPEPAPEDSGPVTKDIVFGKPKQMTEGTNVFLDDVVVRAKSGNLLRVGEGRRSIWVAPNDPSVLDFIAVGAIVDVRGTLRETPSAPQAKLIYAARAGAAKKLARDRLFVDAWDVSAMP
jgi:hypothetical protein